MIEALSRMPAFIDTRFWTPMVVLLIPVYWAWRKTSVQLVLQEDVFPFILKAPVFIPLNWLMIVCMGMTFSLPVGPLCDEGMVLFMEGGCDWGESNIFFFSKLGLILAANFALLVSARLETIDPRHFRLHLTGLCVLGVICRSGGGCDTYYSHPNGSLGQMCFEIAAFSALGISFMRSFRNLSLSLKLLALLAWNSFHVGVFYLGLLLTPHYTWAHTAFVCMMLLGAAAGIAYQQSRQIDKPGNLR